MSIYPVIIFPYTGYEKASSRESMFWAVVECCLKANPEIPPTIVINRDTHERKQTEAFFKNKSSGKTCHVLFAWSVDTCQMWLGGWGHIIDKINKYNAKDENRIVQLPGDIDNVTCRKKFIVALERFIVSNDEDIVIGDFSSGDLFNAKELIDLYGTYALMANWFPKVAREIHTLPLNKPRSEFLNINIKVLRELLGFRKFAYEQTLNMLIRSWDFKNNKWRYKLGVENLGILKDDSSFRRYRDCLDQIERTERMLKLLWREIKYDDKISSEFIRLYDRLDHNSTSIRESSRIIIRNFLEL
jgi:hypothetical protein